MPSQHIPVHETFYSLQGEGAHAGTPAIFVRLAGCNVGCVWCDVKESWDIAPEQYRSVESLVDYVRQFPSDKVIITGGEPTMHDLTGLTGALRSAGKKTHLETAGTEKLTGSWDWICFSPKKFKEPLAEIYGQANELKVVVFHPSDLDWAAQHASRMSASARLFLQPEWSKRDRVMPDILSFLKENTRWNLSLQSHKYIGIP